MRSVPEWQAADDVVPPPRVRVRVFDRYAGICQCGCGTKIAAGDGWELDHQIALINGGANAESNLVPLICGHHRAKTRSDMATKAKTARVHAKHLGIKKAKGRPFATNKDQPYKAKIGGGIERRRSLDRQGHVAVQRRAVVAPSPASPWRSLKLETERLTIERMLWPVRDHLAALNDTQHMRFSEQRRVGHTVETQQEEIDASVRSEHTQYPRLLFYIYAKLTAAGQQLHGIAGSLSVDLDIPNHRADLGVLVLPRWERKGLALEAWKAMIQHLVEKAGIKKIEAGFTATHTAMQNICINSGMIYEGRRESHFDLGNGAREALVYYGASL